MNKIVLGIVFASGGYLFVRDFAVPVNYVLAVLFSVFFFGLLVFGDRMQEPTKTSFRNALWLFSGFLWLANLFNFIAISLNFTLGIMLAFLVSFLIFWGSLIMPPLPGSRRLKIMYGFSAAIILSEFFWTATFFPFSYLTLAGIVFLVLYLIWMIFAYIIQGALTRGMLIRHTVLAAVLLAVLLFSTRWQP